MRTADTNNIPIVDKWEPEKKDIIFTNAKNLIIAPLDKLFQLNNTTNSSMLNCFILNTKKSYNSDDIRNHYCLYLNYFEKYYDKELEYFTNMGKIKFMIDCYPEYNAQAFIIDINRYIVQPSLMKKIREMIEHNYSLELNYKSISNPQLQYNNEHAKIMLHMSIAMNFCIPLITHFAYTKKITDIDEFILDVFDYILYYPEFNSVDIPNKIYQTSISNVKRNERNNQTLWMKQDIRGKDIITHSEAAVRNIILNIMPKYTFSQNMINLNYTSIQKNNKLIESLAI